MQKKHNDFGKVLFKKQENSMVSATFVDLSVGARSLTYRKGLLRTRFFLGVARWPGQLPGGTWTDQLGRGVAPSLVLQGPALAPQRAQWHLDGAWPWAGSVQDGPISVPHRPRPARQAPERAWVPPGMGSILSAATNETLPYIYIYI